MEKYGISPEVLERYEFHNYGHALEILHDAFAEEWKEIQRVLLGVKLSVDDIIRTGGNESPIPKEFGDVLYPLGWREIRISGDLTVKKYPRKVTQRRGKFSNIPFETEKIEGYIDGHNIDLLKNKVAFDLESVSKFPEMHF